MPTTVNELFKNFGIKTALKVPWGTPINSQNGGVYIVSLSPDPSKNLGISDKPNLDLKEIIKWIKKVPNFTIDGKKNFKLLEKRLTEFWLPDENILYIGKAPIRASGKGIGNRVGEYYKTLLGAGSPHSGGQWIKTLANLKACYVYYGSISNSGEVEEGMLNYFIENVSETTLSNLRDKNLPLPFANIRVGTKDKNHGMKNQRL